MRIRYSESDWDSANEDRAFRRACLFIVRSSSCRVGCHGYDAGRCAWM